ncbi:hypothetical protein GYMLUDRAFT_645683 [Collybiopsis luxurians FD-317 M1]|nr:hypothetical protein GYMLUDRAFT_645683 [Collybiopsis luxurians FD-317 M1]
MSSPFSNYTFHPLPDLGSLRRSPISGSCRTSRSLPDALSKQLISAPLYSLTPESHKLLRGAFTSILMQYVDRSVFLFAETSNIFIDDPEGVPVRVVRAERPKPTSKSDWVEYCDGLQKQAEDERNDMCLDDARLEMVVGERYNPLPALVIWELGDCQDPDAFVPQSIIFGAHVQDNKVVLDFLVDNSLVCKATLDQFAVQVATVIELNAFPSAPCFKPPTSFPPALLSCSPSTVELAEEHVALDWLFQHAKNRPDAIAHEIYASMDSEPEFLTYQELNHKSNALARWMVANGIEPEDKVSLCSTRSSQFYVAMAAILKAGGCYVSIDPELPVERKRYIAEDSGSRWVFVTNSEDVDIFGAEKGVVLSIDFIQQVQTEHGNEDISKATLSSLAYLLYTSGTTGNPKGCLLEHRGLYWAMQSFCALPKPVTNPDTDKRLALASTAFDVHISEIVQSWCLGSRLVSAPRFELLTQLRKYIIDIGVTHIGMVPSMIEALLGTPEGLPIKYLVSGGEKITDSLLQKWSSLPNVILANFYGPTEVTIGCTSRRVGPDDRKENIGRPFPSCSAYVVDRDLNIVPMGCPGELVISGPLVARGKKKNIVVSSETFNFLGRISQSP